MALASSAPWLLEKDTLEQCGRKRSLIEMVSQLPQKPTARLRGVQAPVDEGAEADHGKLRRKTLLVCSVGCLTVDTIPSCRYVQHTVLSA